MARDIDLTPKPAKSRFTKYLWLFGGLVVVGGGAYGAGWLQMQQRVDAASEQLAVATRELQTSRERQAEQQRELDELEARRRIHLALIEFDANNFGTAQQHLRAAAALLEASPSSPEVAALAAALRSLELSPALDIASQRAALTSLATKFDNLRPPPAVKP